ncbi:hypothetical protein FoTM2_017178 [Fusarium oxysporum f. sp. vasinfectum]|nr:hypothetical protein FoTM2_017178 [Fusarium oxysporum f. sp. vasinfectum]
MFWARVASQAGHLFIQLSQSLSTINSLHNETAVTLAPINIITCVKAALAD